MNLSITIGIIGATFTVTSLLYAIYTTRRSRRVKSLVYDLLEPVPVVDAISREGDPSIKVIYEQPNKAPETVDSVFIQYIRFINFGRLPIKKDDSTINDPIRIEISDSKVIGISIVKQTRDVCQIQLEEIQYEDKMVKANLNFAFLDFLDGGLIQVVTDNTDAKASLRGTIIGMPEGIKKSKQVKHGITFPDIGCFIPIIMQVAALVAVPYLYRYITGSWDRAWLLILPIAALILPMAVTMPIIFSLLNIGVHKFPGSLRPPHWYGERFHIYNDKRLSGRR